VQGWRKSRLAFILALCDCLKGAFAKVIFPRLLLIGFLFAQPILITNVLRYLGQAEDNQYETYWLIGFTALIYTGMAVLMLDHRF
jgi:hypothetical protein